MLIPAFRENKIGTELLVLDTLSPAARSRNMSRIKGRDTSPELAVRRLLHALGYRYRLHLKNLPGKPDIAFPGRRKAVLVHGCFWHRHSGCRFAYEPKSRKEFWKSKFESNVLRDRAVMDALAEKGWEALVIWECQLKDLSLLEGRLKSFLGAPKARRDYCDLLHV